MTVDRFRILAIVALIIGASAFPLAAIKFYVEGDMPYTAASVGVAILFWIEAALSIRSALRYTPSAGDNHRGGSLDG